MGVLKDVIRKFDPLIKIMVNHERTIYPYYHSVSNSQSVHLKNLFKIKSIKEFEDDLDFLLKNYKVLNPYDLIKAVNSKTEIPQNSFLISFDDGLREVYENAIPILDKKGIPSILFINNKYIDNNALFYKHNLSIAIYKYEDAQAGVKKIVADLLGCEIGECKTEILKIGYNENDKLQKLNTALNLNIDNYLNTNKPYLTTSELQEVSHQGHFIGAHTQSHYPMELLTDEMQFEEVINSIEWVADNTSVNYKLFSFPFSDKFATKSFFSKLFTKYPELICMGNSGFKSDISKRIIQRISFENPKEPGENIVRTNIVYNKINSILGKSKIKRI